MLQNFLSYCNMHYVNSMPSCIGANCTYVSNDYRYSSSIDHIFVPVEMLDLIRYCEIVDDYSLNVSNVDFTIY